MVALEARAQRAVADQNETAAGVGRAHGGEAFEEERVVFLRGHAAGVDDDGVFGRRFPAQAKVAGAAGGVKLPGVDAAGEEGEVAEAECLKLGAELGGGREGAGGAVVDPAEPPEHKPVEGGVAVVLRVSVKVRVETGRDREAERAGGAHGGGAERTLGGDVDEVRAVGAPVPAQGGAGGKAEAQQRVTGDGQTGQRDLREIGGGGSRQRARPARAIDGDRVAATTEFAGDDAKRHRHAIDFRRERFGDEGEFHGEARRGLGGKEDDAGGCRKGWWQHRVAIGWRRGDDFGKSWAER